MITNTDFCLNSLEKGAFLSSGNNVMTIAWGGIGYFWNKKVFFAPVRLTRYTKDFIDKTKCFAVSFPAEGKLRNELKLCGTVSGRDTDKLALVKNRRASKIDAQLIENCEVYYECKVLARLEMSDEMLESMPKGFYKDGDYHLIYIGEIL